MSFIKKTFLSNGDVELINDSVTRNSSYYIYNPQKDNILLVYIPGFGGDLGNYSFDRS